MALLLFPMITLMVVYASQILHLFYGNRYDGAEGAMSVFAIGVGFLTVFYVLAVYFGSVGIKNSRYAVICGLTADIVGSIAAIFVAYLFFA